MTRRLVALTPYAVAPPRHGPQIRVAGVLGNLGPGWEVEHFSQSIQRTDLPIPPASVRGGERWVEHRMRDPLSAAWLIGLGKLGGYPAAYADRLLALAPRRRVRAALASADAVLVSPHYQFPWVRRHTPPEVRIAVDCHCIEGDLWPERTARWTRRVAREIREGEIAAWRAADMVFATCEEEAERIRAAGARDVVVVPNGVDVQRFGAADAEQRAAERLRLGLNVAGLIAVFVGSAGYENVNAMTPLQRQAAGYAAAGVHVVVVGRVGIGREPASNITWTGEVADVVPWLRAADIAVCPLTGGSGTSLKTVEYLAAGLPLVSTPVGARGLGLQDGVHALVREIADFPAAVATLAGDAPLRARLGAAARAHAERHFDWASIGALAASSLERLAVERDHALLTAATAG